MDDTADSPGLDASAPTDKEWKPPGEREKKGGASRRGGRGVVFDAEWVERQNFSVLDKRAVPLSLCVGDNFRRSCVSSAEMTVAQTTLTWNRTPSRLRNARPLHQRARARMAPARGHRQLKDPR